MFSRILAIIMCIASFFTTPFSQISAKAELKNELEKGNYESPYIVRPLDEITINGVSVDEYSVVMPDSDCGVLFSDAVETLCDEIHKACGKEIVTTREFRQNAFILRL